MTNNPTDFLVSDSIVDDYRLTQLLGEGSFGIVFKATHLNTGDSHALKFLKKWIIPEYALSNFVKRFELEFETGKITSKHLVSTHFISSINDLPYYAMDYCPNGNLQKKLKSVQIKDACKFGKEILIGLNDLHNHGKIHRDLKPENILFNDFDCAMLSDFGIAGHINIQLTEASQCGRTEEIFGSYAYMAPEQREKGKRVDTLLPALDIFSFGVVCYEMMTGYLPFGPWNVTSDIDQYLFNAKNGNITDPQIFNITLPAPWKDIIYRCLNPSNRDRYQTTDEIISELEDIDNGKSTQKNILSDQASFIVLNGEQPGRIYSLKDLENIIHVGRQSGEFENEIAIHENCSSYISRKHATIDIIEKQCYIRDGQWNDNERKWVPSKNGTYINYKKIPYNNFQKLYQDDIVLIGNTTLKLIKV